MGFHRQQESLTIGNISFALSTHEGLRSKTFGESSVPFLGPATRYSASRHIPVRIEHAASPLLVAGMQKIYDSESTWRLLSNGSYEYFVYLDYPSRSGWQYAARMPPDLSEITIFLPPKETQGTPITAFSPALMEYPLNQFLVINVLARDRVGVLLHAACAVIEGTSYIFPGRSGAGKSTLTENLRFGVGVTCVNDDRIVIREEGGRFRTFGTPWPGEARIALNRDDPLGGIIFPRKGTKNSLVPVTSTEALQRLLPATCFPWWNSQRIDAVLEVLHRLLSSVPVFDLYFRPDHSVMKTLMRGLGETCSIHSCGTTL